MTWVISRISIQGVKGVLDRAGDFKLSPKRGKPRSIALFGRNGYGKSGYADAIEYLFSSNGEVRHLGKCRMVNDPFLNSLSCFFT